MDGTADAVYQLGIKLWQWIIFVSVVRGVSVCVCVRACTYVCVSVCMYVYVCDIVQVYYIVKLVFVVIFSYFKLISDV